MAVIQWNQDTFLTVVDSYDEVTGTAAESDEAFKKGETSDVDILESDVAGYVGIQFGDGSVAYGVSEKLFTIIEADPQ